MHIIYLHQYFNTPEMSGSTRSFEVARRLVAAGHRVDIITSFQEPTLRKGWFTTDVSGMRVHWLPVKYSNRMNYLARCGTMPIRKCDFIIAIKPHFWLGKQRS